MTAWFNGKEYIDEQAALEAEIAFYNAQHKSSGSKQSSTRTGPKRSVKYVAPGHTVVSYNTRTLHIRFPQTVSQFEAKKKARRRKAAKKSANARRGKTRQYDYDPETRTYRTKSGKITNAPMNAMKGYDDYRTTMGLKNDKYGEIGDMRAKLKDDHWEEICGHKRWMYDNKSLIREYKKYEQLHRNTR